MNKKSKSVEQIISETYTKTEIQKLVGCTFATASKWHDSNEFPIYALEKLGVKITKEFIGKIEI